MGYFSSVHIRAQRWESYPHLTATIRTMNSLSHDLSSASFAYNTSTPNSISRPRVDFRSVESLAISACSHESHGKCACPHERVHRRTAAVDVSSHLSSSLPLGSMDQSSPRLLDDTGYTSMHSSALSFHDDMNKENEPKAKTTTNVQCKVRGSCRSSSSSRILLVLVEKKVVRLANLVLEPSLRSKSLPLFE